MYRRQIFFSVYQKFNLAVWILEKYHSSQQPLFTPLRFLLRKEKQIRLPLSISLAFFSKMVNDRFGQKTSSTPGSQAEKSPGEKVFTIVDQGGQHMKANSMKDEKSKAITKTKADSFLNQSHHRRPIKSSIDQGNMLVSQQNRMAKNYNLLGEKAFPQLSRRTVGVSKKEHGSRVNWESTKSRLNPAMSHHTEQKGAFLLRKNNFPNALSSLQASVAELRKEVSSGDWSPGHTNRSFSINRRDSFQTELQSGQIIDRLADKIYRTLDRKIKIERERRGLTC